MRRPSLLDCLGEDRRLARARSSDQGQGTRIVRGEVIGDAAQRRLSPAEELRAVLAEGLVLLDLFVQIGRFSLLVLLLELRDLGANHLAQDALDVLAELAQVV